MSLADVYPRLARRGARPELDPQSAEAKSLAFVRSLFEWKWPGPGALSNGHRREPGYSHARHWFGVDFLSPLGAAGEALAEVRIARSGPAFDDHPRRAGIRNDGGDYPRVSAYFAN